VDTTKSKSEKLVPPGRVYHIYKTKEATSKYVMEESHHQVFTEIVVAPDMYTDHLPTSYENGFSKVLQDLSVV